MSGPTPEEAASFEWGGTRARPRKKIEAVVKKDAVYLKPPGSCNSKWKDVSISVNIECCEGCTIAILDTTSQVQISECINCRIIVGPCTGSVFLLDCKDCTISVAAKQLRLRDCFDCTLRTYAPTSESVVIETCKDLKFGAWEVCYPGLAAQFAAVADWDPKVNYWDKIYDFSPPEGPAAPRHYTLLPKSTTALESDGYRRWSELTLAPEGLSGGTVTETKGAFGTVDGCECPCLSADGQIYQRQEAAKPAEAAAAPAASSGAAGYARKYAPPSAAPVADDGAAGYARMFGGAGAAAQAEPPSVPAAAPAPAGTVAADVDRIVLTEKAEVVAEEKNPLQRFFSWVGSLFGGGLGK